MVNDDDEDEFDCYNKSDGKPVHTFPEDEIRLHTSEERITPESVSIKINKQNNEPSRRSKRLPFAKQTDKLGSISYAPGRNKKKQNGKIISTMLYRKPARRIKMKTNYPTV